MNAIRSKHNFVFLKFTHPAVSLIGNWLVKEDHAVALDRSCTLKIRLRGVSEAHGVFLSHEWSGKMVMTENGLVRDFADLYSGFAYRKIIPLKTSGGRGDSELELKAIGQNANSRSCQIVFCGLLLLKGEYAPASADESGATVIFEEFRENNEEFQKLQEQMVDNWMEGIRLRGERVEDVVESRFRAYRKRVKNAFVYANAGDRLLDIGAGNIFEKMLTEVIMPSGVDYWTLDIDHRVVDGTKDLFSRFGLDPGHAFHGDNTSLPFDDGFFNVVFSSHCIEHSRDLNKTFPELWRVLKPDGYLAYAVPFGWDDTLEHMYVFNIDDWINLTSSFKFDVLSFVIGKEYPESGYDLFIAARKKA